MQTSLLVFSGLVGTGLTSSWEREGKKAKSVAQAKRGVRNVCGFFFFSPAAAATSEKELGLSKFVGKRLQSPGCTGTAVSEMELARGKTNTNRQLFTVDKVWLFLFHR